MDDYKLLIRELVPFFKSKGFKKDKDVFYKMESGNWGIVTFQKRRDSSPNQISFTINLGICSSLVRTFEHGNTSTKPDLDDCHWKKRIGFLLPQKEDYWWIIEKGRPIIALGQQLISLLNDKALPLIEANISNDSLKERWKNGNADGITEFQRFMFLTVLLKNDADIELDDVLEQMKNYSKGKSIENTAIEHIKELNRIT